MAIIIQNPYELRLFIFDMQQTYLSMNFYPATMDDKLNFVVDIVCKEATVDKDFYLRNDNDTN